mgnify:CR=1 FL=1
MVESPKDPETTERERIKRQLQVYDDFRCVFSTEEGQRVLNHLEDFCMLLSDGFNPDPNVTAYNAGRRSVGVFILEMLEMSRSDLQEMARRQTATKWESE